MISFTIQVFHGTHWEICSILYPSMRRLRDILNRTPQDKAVQTGLQFLAEELIQEILRYLHWPTDFYNLSLVSRTFNRLAKHELYSILIIGYNRPERISALLSHIQKRSELVLLVTTLVFDEDVKSIGPKLLEVEKWPPRGHRRELTDGWDPRSPELRSPRSFPHDQYHEKISQQLNVILNRLPNLRRIILRSLHPLYLLLGLPEKDTRTITEWNLLSDTQNSASHSIWACLSTRAPLVTELFVNGVTNQLPPKIMLSRLTTICISDLYYAVDSHALEACSWHALLSHAPNIRTIGMVHVEYAHVILTGRFFPHLEALELYKVFLGAPLEADLQVLMQFLFRHSSTLRTLALSTHICVSVNHCSWLSDETILPKLQTLRLDNIFALLGATAEPAAEDVGPDLNISTAIEAKSTKDIISFIAHRPTIIDVGISSLATSEADAFAKYLAQTRPMRNIFIGSTVIRSLNAHTSISPRYWDYSYEAWTFYQLFKGLTITRSGFRPRLPAQTWKFWKKTTA